MYIQIRRIESEYYVNEQVFMHSKNSPKYISFNASLSGTRISTPIIASRYDENGVEYIFGGDELQPVLDTEEIDLAKPKQLKRLPKEGFRFDFLYCRNI